MYLVCFFLNGKNPLKEDTRLLREKTGPDTTNCLCPAEMNDKCPVKQE